MRFIWDEGRDMIAIHNIVINHDITLFGPYNEIDNHKDFFGVFHYYFMAPALWIADLDPVGPAAFTAALGVVSVGLVFLLIKNWSNSTTALTTAFLYALSPLVIRYVQWPWNPNTTPFFALCYLLVLTAWWKKKRLSLPLIALAGFLLGILFQLHYFTVVLGVSFLVFLWKKPASRFVKAVWFSVFSALFVLPNLTFVLFDITHEGFFSKILLESFLGSSEQRFFEPSLQTMVFTPVMFVAQTLSELGLGKILSIIFTPIVFLLGALSLRRFWNTKELNLSVLVSLTGLCFLVMISLFSSLFDVYHAAFLWWGVWFLLIEEGQKYLPKKGAGVLAALLFLPTIFQLTQYLQAEPDWSQNWPKVRELSQSIVDDQREHPSQTFNIAAFTDADTRGVRYRYSLVRNGFTPEGVDQYANPEVLYIITSFDESETKKSESWEIDAVRDLPWQLIFKHENTRVYKAASAYQ